MKLTLVIISVFSFLNSFFIYSQDICDIEKGSYFPMIKGKKMEYLSSLEPFSITFSEKEVINGKEYYQRIKRYKSGKEKITFWREEKGAVLKYDENLHIDTKEATLNPKVGESWTSKNKKWKYVVLSLSGKLSTPFCEFNNLLEVTVKNISDSTYSYNFFYKKGVGLIGMKVNSKLQFFLRPFEEINEKPFAHKECINLTNGDLIEKCTSSKIYKHITENIKLPKKYNKGKIVFSFKVDSKGRVSDIKLSKGNPTRKQEKACIKVLKSLPKFIPAQIDDGKPIATSLKIPINF